MLQMPQTDGIISSSLASNTHLIIANLMISGEQLWESSAHGMGSCGECAEGVIIVHTRTRCCHVNFFFGMGSCGKCAEVLS
jgi:hypothetical protein